MAVFFVGRKKINLTRRHLFVGCMTEKVFRFAFEKMKETHRSLSKFGFTLDKSLLEVVDRFQ